jgi:hypothetical protein
LEQPNVLAHDFADATVLRAHLLNGCDYERLRLLDPVASGPGAIVQHVSTDEAPSPASRIISSSRS